MGKEYKVAGITYHIDDIMESLASENDDFLLSRSELRQEYVDGDRVDQFTFDIQHAELVEEPDNPHDPNAIRIDADGVTIGYVSKNDQKEVLAKMHSEDYLGIEITELHNGLYWDISETEDGKLEINKDEYPTPFARFEFKRPPRPAAESTAPVQEKPQLDPKTKSGALSSVVLVASIIMMFVAFPIGIILFIVGIILLIRSRRQ